MRDVSRETSGAILAELTLRRFRKLPQSRLHKAEDAFRRVPAFIVQPAGPGTGEEFERILYAGDRIQMKLVRRHCLDNFRPKHQIDGIGLREDDS
ncbi:MAG: hypothetical protein R3A46_11190 [Thermomicrobiales bacterium]